MKSHLNFYGISKATLSCPLLASDLNKLTALFPGAFCYEPVQSSSSSSRGNDNNNRSLDNERQGTSSIPLVVVGDTMSSGPLKSSEQVTEIPQELHDILLNFTVHYLIQRPGDVVDYALDYFSRLSRSRQEQQGHSEDESMISDEEIAGIEYI
ncbi:Uncharacterized protein FKW44_019402 [Caligus rogercresseyi]|uniref:RIIa domain-containing protein n=1 Tax=Caligus rogercresseyi TaxID=217165 RepID=A0A7T8GVT8_CALRO|nr:Uncharacterized protein FKW44_019402 [Caligus rogercresseyi]